MEHGFDSRRRYNVMLLRCDKGILLCEAKASVVANNALSRCSRRHYRVGILRGSFFLLTTFVFCNPHCTNFVSAACDRLLQALSINNWLLIPEVIATKKQITKVICFFVAILSAAHCSATVYYLSAYVCRQVAGQEQRYVCYILRCSGTA